MENDLEKCIKSLIFKDSSEYEIILVNDGSTDNSGSIIKSYKEKYPLLIKTIDKVNGGLSSARNVGMKNSIGDFITFVDPDDYVEDIFVYNILKNIDDDMLFDLLIFGVVKEEIRQKKSISYTSPTKLVKHSDGSLGKYIEEYDIVGTSYMHGKIFKAEIIKQNNLEFVNVTPAEDTIFFIQFLLHTDVVQFDNYVGYHYIIHPKLSLSKGFQKYDILLKISDVIMPLYDAFFKKFNGISYDHRKRIVSEYGFGYRVVAWLDIYKNKRLSISNRKSLFYKERNIMRRYDKIYGFQNERKKQLYFYYMLISSTPFILVDNITHLFFKLNNK
jgi:glycosyltransferase involved in cell wall biosynthesis